MLDWDELSERWQIGFALEYVLAFALVAGTFLTPPDPIAAAFAYSLVIAPGVGLAGWLAHEDGFDRLGAAPPDRRTFYASLVEGVAAIWLLKRVGGVGAGIAPPGSVSIYASSLVVIAVAGVLVAWLGFYGGHARLHRRLRLRERIQRA